MSSSEKPSSKGQAWLDNNLMLCLLSIIHQISTTIIVYYFTILIPLCRFCTTGLPSDIVVEVDDMTFHLHKVNNSFFSYNFKHKKLPIIVTTNCY